MSTLSLAALAVAQGEFAAGVHGGDPTRFRSPRIDSYRAAMGRQPDLAEPWCAEGVYWCFAQAVAAAVPPVAFNPVPRTPSALHLWEMAPMVCRQKLAAPGDVFVLDRGKGRGHVGFVLSVSPDGLTLTTVEPDTNAAGSSTGDAWGQHLWSPDDGARGVLLGYLDFGAASQPSRLA